MSTLLPGCGGFGAFTCEQQQSTIVVIIYAAKKYIIEQEKMLPIGFTF
jgi:hypothetical protein